MNQKPIYIILSCDDNNGIGHKNALPWCIPDDLMYFKKMTTRVKDSSKQNMIIMGKRTLESLPYQPLPKRVNMILSRTKSVINPDVYIISNQPIRHSISLESAIIHANSDSTIENIFIIGGASVYNEALSKKICDKIFLTKVEGSHDVDTYIDPICESDYHISDIKVCDGHSFITYNKTII